ncbi:hypothetical protein SRHO_G00140570 [Serrasalmus rhombeus]
MLIRTCRIRRQVCRRTGPGHSPAEPVLSSCAEDGKCSVERGVSGNSISMAFSVGRFMGLAVTHMGASILALEKPEEEQRNDSPVTTALLKDLREVPLQELRENLQRLLESRSGVLFLPKNQTPKFYTFPGV